MRAISRTTLTLGDLLDVPVGVAGATGSTEIKLDTAWPDGVKREQLYVHRDDLRTFSDPDDEGADISAYVVPSDREAVKGVSVGNDLRRIPDSEVEWAREVSKLDAVEVLEAIDYRKVPTDRLVGSYWLQPDPGFAKPLATLCAALRNRRVALVVKFNLRSRQKLGVIRARAVEGGHALLVNGLVFAADWRDADDKVTLDVSGVQDRAVAAAVRLLDDLAPADGEPAVNAIDTACDELLPLMSGVVELAHEGAYETPLAVYELAASVRDDWPARADALVAYAEARWPAEKARREAVQAVLAEGGDDVGEKLAALVG